MVDDLVSILGLVGVRAGMGGIVGVVNGVWVRRIVNGVSVGGVGWAIGNLWYVFYFFRYCFNVFGGFSEGLQVFYD